MGKNQTHKAMQMQKHSSRSAGGGPGDEVDARYNGHDASFHTSEWHAARLAALQMERPSWDDWKKQQDEAAAREAAMEAATREQEVEYKRGLEADRARRLGLKEAGVKKKEGKEKKEKRDKKHKSKDSKKKKKHKKSSKDKRSKKKKRRRSSSSSSSGSSSGSDTDSSSLSNEDYGGHGSPVRLSKFFNAK